MEVKDELIVDAAVVVIVVVDVDVDVVDADERTDMDGSSIDET